MTRYINENGDIGVLVSHGWGGGFSTWCGVEDIEFNPKIISAVLNNATTEEITKIIESEYEGQYVFCGGVHQLSVEWVTPGTTFRITEYDGAESLEICDHVNWVIA